MYGYIYKTINLVNNKIYIGQHKYDKDCIDTNYFGSGKLILEAIQKYGKENFLCEILEWCETEEELNKKEIFYIDFYKSKVTNNNYNISNGGSVPRLSGELNSNFGKHRPHTQEEKNHLSEILKGHKPTFTGKHSEETKRKIGENTIRCNLSRDKSIYEKVAITATGNKMMNKDGICIRVHPEDFEFYLNQGYVFGGLSRKGKYKNRQQKKPITCTTKDTIGINNGILNKFVPKSQLNDYLSNDWELGLKKRTNQ